jgi:hypothetical protein
VAHKWPRGDFHAENRSSNHIERQKGFQPQIRQARTALSDLLPSWGELLISEITDLHVAGVIKAKARKGKVAARNLFVLVKRLFRWVKDQPEYGLQHSPCLYLSVAGLLGDMPRTKARVLTDDELFALWRAVSRMPYPHRPAYKLLA